MKVGTDGVLLGAWADVAGVKNILDIGTGTGLIALMLAQRSNAIICGIEIDESAAMQSVENVNNSPWPERVNIEAVSLQDFVKKSAPNRFDLIVSNPPYFNNSMKNPNTLRSLARHTDSLNHSDLIDAAYYLLSDIGRLSVILPVSEGTAFIHQAEIAGLFCLRKTGVIPRPHAPEKRLLLEFSRTKRICEQNTLLIETGKRHEYSDEFKKLTEDFYLEPKFKMSKKWYAYT